MSSPRELEIARESYRRNRDKILRRKREYYIKNRDRIRDRDKISSRLRGVKFREQNPDYGIKWRRDNIIRDLWLKARSRAARKDIPFDIECGDIVIPEVCPVLGTEFTVGGPRDTSPSIDRFDNTRGYIKGNIRIISWRANKLKGDSTIDELRKVLGYMENG